MQLKVNQFLLSKPRVNLVADDYKGKSVIYVENI